MPNVRLIYPDWFAMDDHDRLTVMLGNVLEDRQHYQHIPEFDCEMDGEPLEICERLFCTHNRDDRPRGRHVRSMSCGDIIEIDGVEYVCCSVGWSKVKDLA
jgi:hypothetical protein